jgi:hypothetical protein
LSGVRWNPDEVDIAGGRAETPLRTFHLAAGISVDFP